MRVIFPQPKNTEDCQCHQKLWEKHGTDSPSELPGGTNLVDTLLSDSGLQHPEKTNFCCFNPPTLW